MQYCISFQLFCSETCPWLLPGCHQLPLPTYGEVGELVRCFASGVPWLMEGGKGKGSRSKKGDGALRGKMASIYGPTCLEWYVADLAFLMMGVVNVSGGAKWELYV